MKVLALTAEERHETGFTHKFNILYSDLVTLAAGGGVTTVTKQLLPTGTGTCPAGTCVRRCGMRLVTAFDASDAAINSLLVEVGDGNSTARFMPQTQIAIDGTEIMFFETSQATSTLPYVYLAADGIDAKFTIAGGGSPTIDELTSGELDIYLHIVDYNGLKAPAGDSGS